MGSEAVLRSGETVASGNARSWLRAWRLLVGWRWSLTVSSGVQAEDVFESGSSFLVPIYLGQLFDANSLMHFLRLDPFHQSRPSLPCASTS